MVSLIIPFASNDLRRKEIFHWVIERWRRLFPEWEVIVGSDDIEDFNRSRARNRAFKQSTGDLIIISDADTATTPENIEQAISLVEQGRSWVIAHNVYHSLTEGFTDRLLSEPPDIDLDDVGPWNSDWRMLDRSEAGVLVMPRESFLKVGGYDERFQGWGYEDNAFCLSLNRKCGSYTRTQGPMLHLWHPRGEDFEQPNIKYNQGLLDEMRSAV